CRGGTLRTHLIWPATRHALDPGLRCPRRSERAWYDRASPRRVNGEDCVRGALRAHASSSILQRWLAENDLSASQSPWTLAAPCVGNRSYWSTLAIVAIELDRVHAPLPDA